MKVREECSKKLRIIVGIMCMCMLLNVNLLTDRAYGAEGGNSEVPILMYHHLEGGRVADGATLTESRFEEHMKYLSENDFTPLLPKDILNINSGKMKMPERPVMITFDDGYESNYLRAFPILKKYKMKATIYVITKAMDKKIPNQIPKLTWEQMKEMYKSGLVEIQSHSYDLHNSALNGSYFKYGVNGIRRGLIETQYMYEHRIERDLKQSVDLIEEKIGNDVIAFAYPYGAYDEWCLKPLENQGIKIGLVLGNVSAKVKGDLLKLSRYNASMALDFEALMNKIAGIEIDTLS